VHRDNLDEVDNVDQSVARAADAHCQRQPDSRHERLSFFSARRQFSWGIHVAGVSERLSTAKLFEANTN
jgi:hypothetical protein